MRGNINMVRGPIPSLRSGGSCGTYVTTSVWFGKTPSACDKATIDQVEGIPGYSTASDDQLLVKAQSGDQQAFVELCRRHSPMVKRRILSIVRNREDAEVALQDTLLRAYKHMDTFRRNCKFPTWLTSIGTNTALMILCNRRRVPGKRKHSGPRLSGSGCQAAADEWVRFPKSSSPVWHADSDYFHNGARRRAHVRQGIESGCLKFSPIGLALSLGLNRVAFEVRATGTKAPA